ncbi:sulfatase-like hydrolase/transferase [Paraglaciecola aquimarina]|uniref:Sulfatase-like hydrolase/transferase n=1 Tax=Paraglaciecola aquimarina TaxID=1235557 RepID=A0ABU3SW32_9ALTE|nr:sulfatase-like hydrolase/transferase [Paraglaciecola aquimarina]MDU0354206.1 sulfatase-like hydrolase/transferase [Paraglaciecola aquimarina]
MESKVTNIVLRVWLLSIVLLGLLGHQANASTKRPNFVWLVSEDNSKNYLRLYDPKGAAMPTVEGLAKHGLVFNHAFSNSPVCSTARSTLATGAYAARLGMEYHRPYKQIRLPDSLKVNQSVLNAARLLHHK